MRGVTVNTHPLKSASIAVLKRLYAGPLPRQEINPGVCERLLRENLVESYIGPSLYRTKPGKREYLRITDAGRLIRESMRKLNR